MAEKKEHCVREISSFVTHTATEMERILSRFKWRKEDLLKKVNSSKLIHCPYDFSHRIPASRLNKHLSLCQYKTKDINPQDVCTSPEFFYQTCKAVIPIAIDEKHYSSLKNGHESGKLDTGVHMRVDNKAVPTCCSLLTPKERSAHNTQSMMVDGRTCHNDSAHEIRSIMAWEVIPSSQLQLELHLLSQEEIKTWIIGNLPQVQYLSSVDGASEHLVDFVLSCLQEEKVAHPSGLEEMLKDFLGDETKAFVLNLWKFLAVSVTKEKNSAIYSQMENKTQDSSANSFETKTDVQDHPEPVGSPVKEIPLPMDRVISDFSPQQRLTVYEHVIQAAKAKRETDKQEMDLEIVSDSNESKGTEGDQPKTHFEVLAEQRDYKRRRQSYRAKNVHITKRSAVEVMRDLIETQMHVLEMQYKEEHGITGNNSDVGDMPEEERENKADFKDGTRRGMRDDEETRRVERDRRQRRGGNKRVWYYDNRDSDTKRSRR
nr:U11/U12 small nuclear ribonucleoprotein 48 kDa protein-like [Pocillopora verrucosa]